MIAHLALPAIGAAIVLTLAPHQPAPSPERLEAQLLSAANAFRVDNGLAPLEDNATLAADARSYAEYLARTGKFSHTADGRDPGERAQAAGYEYCELAENLAYEQDDSHLGEARLTTMFMDGWEASPGHRRNLLDPDVIQTGVGVARAPSPIHKYIAVQEFGRPVSMRFSFRVDNLTDAPEAYEFDGARRALPPPFDRRRDHLRQGRHRVPTRPERPFALCGGAWNELCAERRPRGRERRGDPPDAKGQAAGSELRRSCMRIAATALAVLLLSVAGCARAQSDGQNPTAFMAQNALAEGVHVLPSGVQYKVIKSGPGTSRHPTPDDYVTVEYDGSLLNGQVFDSTTKSGHDATFQLKGLITGWVDALQQMKEGDEWIVWIPPSLGYGDTQKGPIPPNSVLVFRLKLVSILGG